MWTKAFLSDNHPDSDISVSNVIINLLIDIGNMHNALHFNRL